MRYPQKWLATTSVCKNQYLPYIKTKRNHDEKDVNHQTTQTKYRPVWRKLQTLIQMCNRRCE